jgi:DNA adenine methylase
MNQRLSAPFPWFGGKSRAAPLIWERMGDVQNYVEPFAGSLAVLLAAPDGRRIETVNDKDGFIANFWRALTADPAAVAEAADWPVNENDLHARHAWLVSQRDDLTARLEGDPDYFDTRIAGWWVWGISCWIGSGWCSGRGPWRIVDRQLVHLGDAGRGVHRKLVHLGDAGRGVHRQLVHLGDAGQGVHQWRQTEWFEDLARRLRGIRVCCGDWTRVLGPSVTTKLGRTGVVLDPPYSTSERCSDLYAVDDGSIAQRVREWAIAHGDDPAMRIVLCGYEGEHALPDGWQCVTWRASGGYGSQGDGVGRANAQRERLWFSPHCRNARQVSIFDRPHGRREIEEDVDGEE